MKKLFVLFLLVALVPFSVGCSLWGNDEDTDVLDYAKASVKAKLPASIVAPTSLRGAVSYTTLAMTINGIPFTVSGTPTLNDDGSYTVTFTSANLTAAERNTLTSTSTTAVITSDVTGSAVPLVSFPVTLGSETGTEFTVTIAADGTITVVSNEGTVGTITKGTFDDKYDMNVTKVTTIVGAETKELTNAVGTAIELAAGNVTPTFAVTYDNDIATLTNVTWKIDVTHVTDAGVTVKAYSLDSSVAADKALFTTNNDAASDTVNITVVAAAAPKNLEAGNIYKVKLTATNLKNTDGGLAAVDGKEYFFKTK